MPRYRFTGASGGNPLGADLFDGRAIAHGEIVEMTEEQQELAPDYFEPLDDEDDPPPYRSKSILEDE